MMVSCGNVHWHAIIPFRLMTRRCPLMIGNRSMSASTPPPSSGPRQWGTWPRSPRTRTTPRPPSPRSDFWTGGRPPTMFSTASSSLRSWPDKLFWVIIAGCQWMLPRSQITLSYIILYKTQYIPSCILISDRLKRSSMRTQATQTDVKRTPPAPPPSLPDMSPRMQKKVNTQNVIETRSERSLRSRVCHKYNF